MFPDNCHFSGRCRRKERSPSDPKTEPSRAENLEGLRLYLSGRTLAYHAQGEEFNSILREFQL